MSYNLTTVFDALVNGAPIVVILIALITWACSLGIKGKTQLITGFVLGFVAGAGYLLSELGQPADFGGWFYLILYGLVIGLAPSGVYETGKKIMRATST